MISEKQKIESGQRVWSLGWNYSGQMLASVGSSKQISIWKQDPSSLELKKQMCVQTDHTKTIRSVNFNRKGDKIACCSFDSTVSIWIYSNQSCEYEMLDTLQGHENEVKAVSWRKDDQKIATCSRDKNIWIWQFDQTHYEYTCDAVLEGHTQDVKTVQWMEGLPNCLVSCSYDNTLRIWEGDDDDYICKQVLSGHNSIVWNVAQANNSKTLLSVSEDCSIIRWDLNENDKYELKYILIGLHSFPIYTCCMLNEKYLVTGGGDNKVNIIVWDKYETKKQPQNGIAIATFQCQSDINCVQACPRIDSTFAICSDDQTIRIVRFQ